MKNFARTISILALALTGSAEAAPADASAMTVEQARNLPTRQLAVELLGQRLGERVIGAVRREYQGSAGSTPREVIFYTQPQWPHPRINGICKTDIITIEYDWFEFDSVEPSSRLNIHRIVAENRYLAFTEPAGEPGTSEHDSAQLAACANFASALAAFRAPSAGDAQWLAAIERQYLAGRPERRFSFACMDVADPRCDRAGQALSSLPLRLATDVRLIDCPRRGRDSVRYCYRLEFARAGTEETEWVMTIVAGMRDGMAPVEIRSLHLEAVPQSLRMH